MRARYLIIPAVILVLLLASVPARAASIVINEFLADPATGILGDANGDGLSSSTQDEFVELVNSSDTDLDISGWLISDSISTTHVFPTGTVLSPGAAIVVFGGGTPTGEFGGAIVQTASSSNLSLNNTGDTITVSDGVTNQAVATFGRAGNYDQSLTLNPDVYGGTYEGHLYAAGSGGRRFSPGTMVDGTPFVAPVPVPGSLLLLSSGVAVIWRTRRTALQQACR